MPYHSAPPERRVCARRSAWKYPRHRATTAHLNFFNGFEYEPTADCAMVRAGVDGGLGTGEGRMREKGYYRMNAQAVYVLASRDLEEMFGKGCTAGDFCCSAIREGRVGRRWSGRSRVAGTFLFSAHHHRQGYDNPLLW